MIVYLLTDPRNLLKGYVGQTRRSATKRLGDHLKAAQYGSQLPVHRWIRKLIRQGASPRVEVLRACVNSDELNQVERDLIADYRSRSGMKLYNVTDGGDCGPLGEQWKRACKAGNARPEVKARRAQSAKAGWDNPEVRARRVAGLKKAGADPSFRATKSRQSQAMWDRTSPEDRAKRGARTHSPETDRSRSEKMSVWNAAPGRREFLSQKSRAFWRTPEGRRLASENATEVNSRPEIKERIRQTTADRWKDPAYKARVAAAISAGARKAPQHGSYSEYSNHKCRCRPCKDAAAKRSRDWRASRRAEKAAG